MIRNPFRTSHLVDKPSDADPVESHLTQLSATGLSDTSPSRINPQRRAFLMGLPLAGAIVLAGCGQKGALYIEGEDDEDPNERKNKTTT